MELADSQELDVKALVVMEHLAAFNPLHIPQMEKGDAYDVITQRMRVSGRAFAGVVGERSTHPTPLCSI